MPFRPLSFSLVLAGSLLATHAGAQTNDSARALALFNQARDLMAGGNYAEACPKFAESVRLLEKVGTLAKLAECDEKQGRLVAALAHWRRARAVAQAESDQRLGHVEAEVARVEGIVPKLRVAPPPSGVTVKLDGEPVVDATLQAPIPVEPGAHTLEASAPGKRPWSQTVSVRADGAATNISIPPLVAEAGRGPTEGPTASEAAQGGTSPLRTAGWVVAGIGVVGLGIGTAFGVTALSKNASSNTNGCTGDVCTTAGGTIRNDARSAGNLATVFVVGGAVLAGAGVALVLFAPSKRAPASVALGLGDISVRGAW